MPDYFHTPAIVLNKKPHQEQDLLLTVITPKKGKITILAKGVRKITSRRRPVLEIANLVELELHLSHGRYYLDHAQLLDGFHPIKNELPLIPLSLNLVEMTDALTLEEKSLPAIFKLLKNTLQLLSPKNKPDLLGLAFKINILTILGHLPDLKHCHLCDKPLTKSRNYYEPNELTLFCANCQTKNHQKLPEISLPNLKCLNFLQKFSLQESLKIKITPSQIRLLQKYLEKPLENHLHKELQSEKISVVC